MPWHWLPPDLQLHVAEALLERLDRAALCLAIPHLGVLAQRRLITYKPCVLMSLAIHLVRGGTIDEVLLRRYAARDDATVDGCDWLTSVSAAYGSSTMGYRRESLSGADAPEVWCLLSDGAKLRYVFDAGDVRHFEGESGAERHVRMVFSNGDVRHYEGEMGAERCVRLVFANDNGMVHFEGERGVERVVRMVSADGAVMHFEGESGAERRVRRVRADGTVMHFEGERDAERLVRAVSTTGDVWHFEGERNAERPVRVVLPTGGVWHLEGEKGAERLVRASSANGDVRHPSRAERVVWRRFNSRS
jgi:hypothetical protein